MPGFHLHSMKWQGGRVVCAGLSALLILLSSCNLPSTDGIPGQTSASDELPELTVVPYEDPGLVWISMEYTESHCGIDFAARENIPIVAPADGVFRKEVYYHEGVPRWQVNAEIQIGGYVIELLFEPGDHVTETEAATQFDTLIADGTRVSAGDPLGTLYVASGQDHAYLHLAVRAVRSDQFECPMLYSSAKVQTEFLELFHRDHPGEQICYDQTY